jgi:CelD/BcsL family acetyltransferase involved in cellulose biosynthesis
MYPSGTIPAAGAASCHMDPRVACIDTERGFEALRDEWNGVLARSASNNLFLTWEWVSTWWELYGAGANLYVLTARDADGVLIGIAPLQRRRRAVLGLGSVDVLEFIGSGGDVTPEQLDFIVVSGAEAEVTPALVSYIEDDPLVRGIDLRPFAAASPNLPFVDRVLRSVRGRLRCVADSVCPVLPLPASKAEFIASRSKNYRKKMREYQRRCERDLGAHVRISGSHAELDRDMGALVALHQKRWEGRSRAFRTTAYLEFHRRLASRLFDKGWVRMFALDSSHGPVAMLYCFAYADRYYFYQAGRDPEWNKHRVGLVLMHNAIEQAIDEHAQVFDFLRGEEDYKYMWAAAEVKAVRLAHWKTWPAWAVGRLAIVIAGAHSSMASASAALVSMIGSWNGLIP